MTNPETADKRTRAARDTADREAFRLARDSGAAIVTRPMFRRDKAPAVRDAEPLAGARAARDLELAAHRTARDYIRRAREAGHGWEQIGAALGLVPGGGREGATGATGAYTYAAGTRESGPPWEPRSFGWTCRSCDEHISDRGLIQGPADDELGHAEDCPRLGAAVAEWNARAAQWAAEWEAGQ